MDIEEARQLEIAARRPLVDGVWHPDRCEKLVLHGVEFAVQPLVPTKGLRFTPRLEDGRAVDVDVQVGDGKADDDLLAEARAIAESAPITGGEKCPQCGRVTGGELEIDPDAHREFLCRLVGYAAMLLGRQYTLTDEQIGQLLGFDGDGLPQWIVGVVRHALGFSIRSNTSGPSAENAMGDFAWENLSELVASVSTESADHPLGPNAAPRTRSCRRRRWWGSWKFWKFWKFGK